MVFCGYLGLDLRFVVCDDGFGFCGLRCWADGVGIVDACNGSGSGGSSDGTICGSGIDEVTESVTVPVMLKGCVLVAVRMCIYCCGGVGGVGRGCGVGGHFDIGCDDGLDVVCGVTDCWGR